MPTTRRKPLSSEKAALLIQCWWRCQLARRRAWQMRIVNRWAETDNNVGWEDLNGAAVRIQSLWRGFRDRRMAEYLRAQRAARRSQWLRREEALQSKAHRAQWRNRVTVAPKRQGFVAAVCMAAATAIQSVFRGYWVRTRVVPKLKLDRALQPQKYRTRRELNYVAAKELEFSEQCGRRILRDREAAERLPLQAIWLQVSDWVKNAVLVSRGNVLLAQKEAAARQDLKVAELLERMERIDERHARARIRQAENSGVDSLAAWTTVQRRVMQERWTRLLQTTHALEAEEVLARGALESLCGQHEADLIAAKAEVQRLHERERAVAHALLEATTAQALLLHWQYEQERRVELSFSELVSRVEVEERVARAYLKWEEAEGWRAHHVTAQREQDRLARGRAAIRQLVDFEVSGRTDVLYSYDLECARLEEMMERALDRITFAPRLARSILAEWAAARGPLEVEEAVEWETLVHREAAQRHVKQHWTVETSEHLARLDVTDDERSGFRSLQDTYRAFLARAALLRAESSWRNDIESQESASRGHLGMKVLEAHLAIRARKEEENERVARLQRAAFENKLKIEREVALAEMEQARMCQEIEAEEAAEWARIMRKEGSEWGAARVQWATREAHVVALNASPQKKSRPPSRSKSFPDFPPPPPISPFMAVPVIDHPPVFDPLPLPEEVAEWQRSQGRFLMNEQLSEIELAYLGVAITENLAVEAIERNGLADAEAAGRNAIIAQFAIETAKRLRWAVTANNRRLRRALEAYEAEKRDALTEWETEQRLMLLNDFMHELTTLVYGGVVEAEQGLREATAADQVSAWNLLFALERSSYQSVKAAEKARQEADDALHAANAVERARLEMEKRLRELTQAALELVNSERAQRRQMELNEFSGRFDIEHEFGLLKPFRDRHEIMAAEKLARSVVTQEEQVGRKGLYDRVEAYLDRHNQFDRQVFSKEESVERRRVELEEMRRLEDLSLLATREKKAAAARQAERAAVKIQAWRRGTVGRGKATAARHERALKQERDAEERQRVLDRAAEKALRRETRAQRQAERRKQLAEVEWMERQEMEQAEKLTKLQIAAVERATLTLVSAEHTARQEVLRSERRTRQDVYNQEGAARLIAYQSSAKKVTPLDERNSSLFSLRVESMGSEKSYMNRSRFSEASPQRKSTNSTFLDKFGPRAHSSMGLGFSEDVAAQPRPKSTLPYLLRPSTFNNIVTVPSASASILGLDEYAASIADQEQTRQARVKELKRQLHPSAPPKQLPPVHYNVAYRHDVRVAASQRGLDYDSELPRTGSLTQDWRMANTSVGW
eukprot:TRINITY_DN9419_c0_g1_i1.p1 TRINITY_DN9419_c0_g1~~TRINITY_DN9419_c0_g1_i1.p1  ORF type:complete len:1308 (+),score=253.92 TRINITY_DN9419_c0_g1_i1:64-3987(+)